MRLKLHGDSENLGAVKAILGSDGRLSVFVYGNNGHADASEISFAVEADAEEILDLAVLLTENADEKKLWDMDIRKLSFDDKPDDEAVQIFLDSKKYYIPMIERRKLWEMTAIVSKKSS